MKFPVILKSGGPWAAALVAVVFYLVRRQSLIDNLHKTHQEKIEALSEKRLQDHGEFHKTVIAQNELLATCLNGLADSQNKMAETLTKLCETLDEMFVDKSTPTGRRR